MYAVAFDLVVADTEQHHPKGVSQAYADIAAILNEHGFRRVQGSLYVTDNEDMAKQRIGELKATNSDTSNLGQNTTAGEQIQVQVAPLLPFDPCEQLKTGIPFALDDYLELLDTVGRVVHPNKRGAIPETAPALLNRLGISVDRFIEHSDRFLYRFGVTVGAPAALVEMATARNLRYLRGVSKSRDLYQSPCRKAA